MKLVELLVFNKADINTTTNDGSTALFGASQQGLLDICRYLLSEDCDVNAMDDRKWTSLHEASFNGHLEVADHLIAKGATIDAKATVGSTPLT